MVVLPLNGLLHITRTMAHHTITQLEQHLADIGAGKYGKDVTYAYVEIGRYKPYNASTVAAARRRGYKVDKAAQGVFHIHPKATAAAAAQ